MPKQLNLKYLARFSWENVAIIPRFSLTALGKITEINSQRLEIYVCQYYLWIAAVQHIIVDGLV